ncbi:MAG: hypothetical protein UHZ01_08120, partial [Prevotella sp.]|nr:hypothetical protein [Prevotella sp.]
KGIKRSAEFSILRVAFVKKKEQKTHSPHTQNIIKSKRKRKINDVFGNNLYICMIYPRKEFLYKDVIPSLTERSQAQNYDN